MKTFCFLFFYGLLFLVVNHSLATKETRSSCNVDSTSRCKDNPVYQKRNINMRGKLMNTGSGAQGASSAGDDAGKAVEEAKKNLNSAKTHATTILEEAKKAKADAEKLDNEEVKKAQEAKETADETGKNVQEAAEYVTKAETSFKKVQDETSTAKSKAAEAEKKAQDTATKIDAAIGVLEAVETASNPAKTEEEKKTAAKTAEGEATTLKGEADQVTPLTTAAQNAITSVQSNLKEVQIAMHQVKMVVAAEKVTKAHSEVEKDHTNAVAQQNAVNPVVSEINGMISTCPEGAKEEVTKLHKTAEETQRSLADKVTELQNAVNDANSQKAITDNAMKSVDSLSDVNNAQTESKKTTDAATSVEGEVTKRSKLFTEVETYAKKIEKLKYEAMTTVNLAKIKEFLKKVEEYVADAKAKEAEVTPLVHEVTSLENSAKDPVKAKLKELLDAAKISVGTFNTQKEAITSSHNKLKEYKQTVEDTLKEAKKDESNVTVVQGTAESAQKAAASAKTEEQNATNAFDEVNKATNAIKRKKFEADATVATEKADTQWQAATKHLASFNEKKSAAENAVAVINKVKEDLPSEVENEVNEQLGIAQGAVTAIAKQETTVAQAVESADTQKKSAESALNDIKMETTQVSDALSKSIAATKAAQTAEEAATNAIHALTGVSLEVNKALKAQHTALCVVSAKKVDASLNKAQRESAQISVGMKKRVTDALAEITSIHNTAPESVKSDVNVLLEKSENALRLLTQQESAVTSALKEMETSKIAANTALVAVKSSNDSISADEKSKEAETAKDKAHAKAIEVSEAIKTATKAVDAASTATYAAVALVAFEKVSRQLNAIKEHSDSVAKLEDITKNAVNAIAAKESKVTESVSTEIMNKLSVAKNALQKLTEAVKRIGGCIVKAEGLKQTALSARTKATAERTAETEVTLDALKAAAQEAQTAATSAEAEEGIAKTELSNATEESKRALTAKEDALQIVQKYENTVGKTVPQFVPSQPSVETEENITEELKGSLPLQANEKQESKDGMDGSKRGSSPSETDEDKAKENEQKASAHQNSSDEVTIDEAEAVHELEEQPKQRTAKPSSDSSTFSDVFYWKVPTALIVIFLMNLRG